MAKNKQERPEEDFGFSQMDFDEIKGQMGETDEEVLIELKGKIEEIEKDYNHIYKSYNNLIEALRKNPEKEYFHWPDRAEKMGHVKAELDMRKNRINKRLTEIDEIFDEENIKKKEK